MWVDNPKQEAFYQITQILLILFGQKKNVLSQALNDMAVIYHYIYLGIVWCLADSRVNRQGSLITEIVELRTHT